MSFLKIATQMLAVNRIQSINTSAVLDGKPGVEIKLFGEEEGFAYTGEYAELAYNLTQEIITKGLPKTVPTPESIIVTVNGNAIPVASITTLDGEVVPVSVLLDGKQVLVSEIEWADLNVTINGQQGVEVRVSSDAPGTRKYFGDMASEVYDILVALAPAEPETQQAAS